MAAFKGYDLFASGQNVIGFTLLMPVAANTFIEVASTNDASITKIIVQNLLHTNGGLCADL